GAHTEAGLRTAQARARQWTRHGADVQELDRGEVAGLLGTARYLGGWIDRRGGAIQPLSYVRGLARAALAAGATVHTDSPVASLQRQGSRWVARTANGAQVEAERVVMCTNAYCGDLWPGLKPSIIDANTYQVATRPLPPDVAASILPQGQVSSDT